MERPRTPREEDCCGNGCSPCIFDVHKNLVKYWEERDENSPGKRNILELLSYKSFWVEETVSINDEYCFIWLVYPASESEEQIHMNVGQHIMINVDSWTRAFSPISWTATGIQLLVRIYENSCFTSKLKSIEIGERIRVRGPYGDFRYSRNSFRKIIMFGIGSGIAVFYPILKAITEDEVEDTRVHLIVGFKSIELIPLKKELQLLADYWNVNCTLQLAELAEGMKINGINVKHGRINERIVEDILGIEKSEGILVLVCGNTSFNRMLERCLKTLKLNNYHIFE
ncbi:NADH-cytochrome b5 reductase-like [Fopius arisanus]|uniref:NADH-cytochrome b5 reductase-like n=1 Tax=Fopius arisanus TaxID=64838 RepID=A0A9R1TT17_9HYME|nr:PREDICTED: NADH-cytochrome b5 reductase-like [Fopius arisanus]XP_011297836.1 PREDICTED: NADH-cytochrome b5 reductase-like [Fopius arisanus]XP_011297837.1 PREDICTED: NADH-cytochrome b5 reductase-like [Fopius arisanus]XP_011297838.1 PREDICTED: NADH-cytochrome b5 reductase-like [Fopius arisanus]